MEIERCVWEREKEKEQELKEMCVWNARESFSG